MKHYPTICKIKQPFFYSFPRLCRESNLQRESTVKTKVSNVSQTKIYEVKGGICFKFICVVFHLMEILPTKDFSQYIELFLLAK